MYLCLSIHTNWLLRETISYNVERENNVYEALLDIKKAFDSIWNKEPLYRLFEIGTDRKLWN